jgi:quaternary ammonium compound-resistance protein SugE
VRQDGAKEFSMSWLVLVLSGVLEAVWATALGRSEGFTRPLPSLVFAVSLVLSMAGLAWAMRDLPVGTSYAVWVGIGAALTVAWAMTTGAEPYSLAKVLLLGGLVACVVGLKAIH